MQISFNFTVESVCKRRTIIIALYDMRYDFGLGVRPGVAIVVIRAGRDALSGFSGKKLLVGKI